MKRYAPSETFFLDGRGTGLTVSDFWQWGFSELARGPLLGILGEYLVSSAINRPDMRRSWGPYACISPSGRRVEVKTSACIQSWTADDCHSRIWFDMTPDAGLGASKARNSDLCVFAVYTAMSHEECVLDLGLWDFYVLATSKLNCAMPRQGSLTLDSIKRLSPIMARYGGLLDAVESISMRKE